ncbi:MAG TPA: hypothetical protein VNF49_13675 [Candidatus Binataceae bacterium]|nr:hypothetical protein [Candidatus Binataceae bacterium]
MMARSMAGSRLFDEAAAAKGARWLQTPDGDGPVLLIAPHGGHAGPATRALLNPKVNDLHTADITRELARRLGAGAIINSGMDRNRLDLNRLSQVMSEAPWMLELIAGRLERIVARSGRAVVLLIHGWNVIEPRVDLGVGVKSAGATLLPACGAHVSASDGFINGPLLDFVESLRRGGIKPTFGLRYPGAGANNLLQAFTQRHASSPVGALRRLAALNARGALEAVQLELSVALRMPGRLRTETIAALAESFARCDRPAGAPHTSHLERPGRIEIIRTAEAASSAPKRAIRQSSIGPLRVGLEFYDSSAQLGVMASFDLGSGAAGARVMAVAGRERITLFTAEGRVERTPQSLTLGPLALRVEGGRLRFDFAGPAVGVEDGTAYLSVERALAKAALHEAMELHAEFEAWPESRASAQAAETLIERITRPEQAADGIFGRVTGEFSIGGARHRLEAVARLGLSFVGIGNGAFNARRMIWAAFPGAASPHAVEARALTDDGGAESASARVLDRGRWTAHSLQRLKLTPATSGRPPRRIGAILRPAGNGVALALEGEVRSFMMLSRPGPAQSRILTSLGFASFRIGEHCGAGMFECSYRSASAPRATEETSEADNDES